MKIKSKIIYHLTPIRMTTMKERKEGRKGGREEGRKEGNLSPKMQISISENVQKLELSYTADWNVNWYNYFGR